MKPKMKFDWHYAITKLLVFFTSTKNLPIFAATLYALFGLKLSPDLQGYIVSGAAIALSALKLFDSIHDKTPAP